MISLVFQDGQVFVWNAQDWEKLQELRIVGSLIGSLATFPRQWKFPGLPLALSPEETSLLVEIGAARVIRHPSLKAAPNDLLKQKHDNYLNSVQQEQVDYFRNERKRQVRDMIDDIVEGKRSKLLGYPAKKKRVQKTQQETTGSTSDSQSEESQSAVIDKDAVLKEELEKIDEKQLDSKDLVIPTFTDSNHVHEELMLRFRAQLPHSRNPVHEFVNKSQTTAAPWVDEAEEIDWLDWVCPRTKQEKLCYMTFKDMWEKGHFITSGQKFGGDFLVYPGDPRFYHAHFIVICLESNALNASDIVALGRLGNSVRKTVILASFSEDESSVVYQSLQWNSLL